MKKQKGLKTKIFCDSADIKVIKKLNKNPLVRGFTTNPSLMRLSGAKNYKNYSQKILKICKNKLISFEMFLTIQKEWKNKLMKLNLSLLLCWIGIHHYKIIDVSFGFGAGGSVKTVQCKICRIKKTKIG